MTDAIYYSQSFTVVGLSLVYVFHSWLKSRERFMKSLVEVKELQNQLSTSIHQLQEAHKEITQLKSDISTLNFKMGMKGK